MENICKKCLVSKPLDQYSKNPTSKTGISYICKPCAAQKARDWYQQNRERAVATRKAWNEKNTEKAREYFRKSKKVNNGSVNASTARRHAAKMRATVAWANKFFIDEIYRLSALRTKMTGFQWHVDHIVPLQSKYVCGLHVEANLRVIPWRQNVIKHNRYWPDMPEIANDKS